MHFNSAVPQAADFLDAQPLSKGKTEKTKNKKKEAGKGAYAMDTGFITLPAPQSIVISNGNSPGPSGFSSGIQTSSSGSPAPMMKPGFSRISSAMDSPSQGSTPGAGERTKVVFGFGTKRKAGDEAEGSPPSKRR